MRRLRAGLIGSIRAWLPSRRSTAHHIGARVTTRSGQVRSGSRIGSTSSANGRYRRTAIEVPRWVFHAGWPGLGGPDGMVMVRADTNASDESATSTLGSVGVILLLLSGLSGTTTGASRNTRDGKPVWIRPRRGVREGAPAARHALYRIGENALSPARGRLWR